MTYTVSYWCSQYFSGLCSTTGGTLFRMWCCTGLSGSSSLLWRLCGCVSPSFCPYPAAPRKSASATARTVVSQPMLSPCGREVVLYADTPVAYIWEAWVGSGHSSKAICRGLSHKRLNSLCCVGMKPTSEFLLTELYMSKSVIEFALK